MSAHSRLRSIRRVLLVALVASTTPTVATDGSARALEERYSELTRQEDLGAKDLLGISSWCMDVSESLPAAQRRTFRERARACARRAERVGSQELEILFRRARKAIAASDNHASAMQHREVAIETAQDLLDAMVSQASQHVDLERFHRVYQKGVDSLDEALTPLRSKHVARLLQQGLIPLGGEWKPANQPSPQDRYDGVVRLSDLRHTPDTHAGRRVSTSLVTSGEVFELLDLLLIDGFDDRGNYLPPHFMPQRLVITLGPGPSAWKEFAAGAGESTKSTKPAYRFQVVLRVRAESRQQDPFYVGEIEHLSVFDEHGRLVRFFESATGGER